MTQGKVELAIRKKMIWSILILVAIFLVDNRAYFFTYLPFQDEYKKVDASIDYGYLRNHYVNVNVPVSEEEIITATVKCGIGEGAAFLEEIVVGYSENRKPAVVRVTPVVTSGLLVVAVVLLFGNIAYVRRINKLLEKEE